MGEYCPSNRDLAYLYRIYRENKPKSHFDAKLYTADEDDLQRFIRLFQARLIDRQSQGPFFLPKKTLDLMLDYEARLEDASDEALRKQQDQREERSYQRAIHRKDRLEQKADAKQQEKSNWRITLASCFLSFVLGVIADHLVDIPVIAAKLWRALFP